MIPRGAHLARTRRERRTRCALVAAAWTAIAGSARAQAAPPPDGVTVGDFWFRPWVELRTRGEYYHHPVETFGGERPVLGSTLGVAIPSRQQWVVHERSRLGLGVERGFLSASLVVQDARLAGSPSPADVNRSPTAATTSFYLAFAEARSAETYPSFVRIGRQEIVWGEGRLLGASDWSLTPRSFDAARARWVIRQFDLEGLAALLSTPDSVPPEYDRQGSASGGVGAGTGAQLYGLRLTAHLDPLAQGELFGLGRVARLPLPNALTPSDTIALGGRLSGDGEGFSYAAELVYELGNLATLGSTRKLSAWGATAHADWQTSWVFRPKLSLSGSYATGDDGTSAGASHRFDPMFPDSRSGLGQMGIYAWTNVLDGAFNATALATDEITVTLAYRYVRLANPHGAWFSASLAPVGQKVSNEASYLGSEVDASIAYTPIEALTVAAGYGAFFTGQGARGILGGDARLLSAAFLQARVAAP